MAELANVLRTWRDRVSPEAVGLPGGPDRRAPGLRREELAALAGLSVDYVVRLEQGRSTNPSPQVLGALTRALRLNQDERDHLYRAAGAAVPPALGVPQHITPGIQRIVDRLGDTPVSVYSAAWDPLLWNPLWSALLGDPSIYSGREANLVWRWFTAGHSRVLYEEDARRAFARDLVADLHAASGRYPVDGQLAELIADLRRASPAFEELWGTSSVGRHVEGHKTIDNPTVGRVTLDCDVLAAPGTDMKIVVYTAVPGTTDAEKLQLLRVAGLQSFATES